MATFLERQASIMDLYRQERFDQALEEAELARRELPARADVTWFWVACLQCRVGRNDDALATIRSALEQDVLYRIQHLSDPDLEPIRQLPEFAAIVTEVEARVGALGRKPEVRSVAPPRVLRPPLLLCLHGAASSAGQFVPHLAAVARCGWLAAAAQSSQPAGPATYHWDDQTAAAGDLAAYRDQLEARHAFDAGRVVLAGFSQGGTLALRAALKREPFQSAGVLGICPSFPGEASHTTRLIDSAAGPPLYVAFLLGAGDGPYTESAQRVAEALDRAGHKVEAQVIPGLGHEMPPDLEARLPALLRRLSA